MNIELLMRNTTLGSDEHQAIEDSITKQFATISTDVRQINATIFQRSEKSEAYGDTRFQMLRLVSAYEVAMRSAHPNRQDRPLQLAQELNYIRDRDLERRIKKPTAYWRAGK